MNNNKPEKPLNSQPKLVNRQTSPIQVTSPTIDKKATIVDRGVLSREKTDLNIQKVPISPSHSIKTPKSETKKSLDVLNETANDELNMSKDLDLPPTSRT
jgi:hypothetical protein